MINDHDAPRNILSLPNDTWQHIFQFLDVDQKDIALVSQQFLRAWRAGVVGVYIQIPPGHYLSFLTEQQYNNFPNLKFADVADDSVYQVEGSSPRDVSLRSPGLSLHLTFSRSGLVREAKTLLAEHPRLAALVTRATFASGGHAFEDCWQLASVLPNLHTIKLHFCKDVPDTALQRLAELPSLTSLSLFDCAPFEGSGLQALVGAGTRLHSLSIGYGHFEGEHLRHLPQSTTLRELAITGCTSLQPAHLESVGACSAIDSLSLKENPLLDAECLASLAKGTTHLKELDISYCPNITDDALMALAPMSELVRLNLIGCGQVSAEGIRQLASQLPQLREVTAYKPLGHTEDKAPPLFNANGEPVAIALEKRAFWS